MHQTMLSPQVGGPGIHRGICHFNLNFHVKAFTQGENVNTDVKYPFPGGGGGGGKFFVS